MRYRLRTLLVLLTIGPLILALGWWEYGKYRERERLLAPTRAGVRLGSYLGLAGSCHHDPSKRVMLGQA